MRFKPPIVDNVAPICLRQERWRSKRSKRNKRQGKIKMDRAELGVACQYVTTSLISFSHTVICMSIKTRKSLLLESGYKKPNAVEAAYSARGDKKEGKTDTKSWFYNGCFESGPGGSQRN